MQVSTRHASTHPAARPALTPPATAPAAARRFNSYALALWYGAQRVADGSYTGGQVLAVLIASLLGSFSLGLVSLPGGTGGGGDQAAWGGWGWGRAVCCHLVSHRRLGPNAAHEFCRTRHGCPPALAVA